MQGTNQHPNHSRLVGLEYCRTTFSLPVLPSTLFKQVNDRGTRNYQRCDSKSQSHWKVLCVVNYFRVLHGVSYIYLFFPSTFLGRFPFPPNESVTKRTSLKHFLIIILKGIDSEDKTFLRKVMTVSLAIRHWHINQAHNLSHQWKSAASCLDKVNENPFNTRLTFSNQFTKEAKQTTNCRRPQQRTVSILMPNFLIWSGRPL